jgi:hypothetical protein
MLVIIYFRVVAKTVKVVTITLTGSSLTTHSVARRVSGECKFS